MNSFELSVVDISDCLWPYLGTKAQNLIKNCDNKPASSKLCSVLTLAKVVTFKEQPYSMPEEWIQRFALLVNKLAEADRLTSVLKPPVYITLAKLEVYRLMLCFYVFSDFEREELNEWLGNEAFIEEGGCGNEDWSNLP